MTSPSTAAFASDVTERDIVRRAFQLYCDRSREDGQDVGDWLNAERELRDASECLGRVIIELTVSTFLDQRVLRQVHERQRVAPAVGERRAQVEAFVGTSRRAR